MNNLYIIKYNNYYNRLVKFEENIADYISKSVDNYYYFLESVNFNPNDGVNTEQLIGGTTVNEYDGSGNYLIITNPLAINGETIVSRWFIVESVRTRSGQFKLTLRRDLIADYYNIIAQSPLYVEKAIVKDSDPAIWNSEGVSVNQIKTKEYLLKDASNCAWIVGYFDRDYSGPLDDGGNITPMKILQRDPIADFELDLPEGKTPEEVIEEYLADKDVYAVRNSMLAFDYLVSESGNYVPYSVWTAKLDSKNPSSWDVSIVDYGWTGLLSNIYEDKPDSFVWLLDMGRYDELMKPTADVNQKFSRVMRNLLNAMPNQSLLSLTERLYRTTSHPVVSRSQFADVDRLVNKIVKVGDRKFRLYNAAKTKVKLYSRPAINYDLDPTGIDGTPAIWSYINKAIHPDISVIKEALGRQNVQGGSYGPTNNLKFHFLWDEEHIELSYESADYSEFTYAFPTSNSRTHLLDAPYDMFAIPYSETGMDIAIYSHQEDRVLKMKAFNAQQALSAAQSIAEIMGSNLYDLQLLPYIPSNTTYGYSQKAGDDKPYFYAFSDSTEAQDSLPNGFSIYFPILSSFSHQPISFVDESTDEQVDSPFDISNNNKKIINDCDMFRLVSPNYNGQFEFNSAKLDADKDTSQLLADYTYLPYSPYIHIYPEFDGLYGGDFGDCRGLICQGDFSISFMSDKWQEYKIQNKNFQNTFNSQISLLETTNQVARQKEKYDLVAGVIQGGVSGILSGALSGGGIGGAVGGAIGTGLSVYGGIQDIRANELLRNKSMDTTKDLFNYSLQNIQAMPNSLTTVTSYSVNNKIFPILEYYTCTEEEKRAIANKIAYNGMTVMRIDTISSLVGNSWEYEDITAKNYIKGKLIRFLDDQEDFHLVNEISAELDKGAYFTQYE